MTKKIIKRDGTLVDYDARKIKKAILMAFNACGEHCGEVDEIVAAVGWVDNVEGISDRVEDVLIDYGYISVAKAYIRYREGRRLERDLMPDPMPDPGLLSDYIFKSKYGQPGESWEDCVERVFDMHAERGFNNSAAKNYVLDRVILPSMRSLQFGGVDGGIVRNNYRMYNCSYTKINRVNVFGKLLHRLLSGCGVGFSVQQRHIECLPVVGVVDKRKVVHYTIDDSIEGWGAAVDALVGSYFGGGGEYIEFCYSQIRGEGSIITGCGPCAPGHMGLKNALENVRAVFDKAVGRKLRGIEVMDICCYLAEAVVAGGIRRSAMICLFDWFDTEIMYSKCRGVIEHCQVPRYLANISACVPEGDDNVLDRVIRLSATEYGEPGFFRVGAGEEEYGTNPCGEILFQDTQDSFGYCNLAEINMMKVDMENAYAVGRCAGELAWVQGSYRDWDAEDIDYVHRQGVQYGVSITGVFDRGVDEVIKLCKPLREGVESVLGSGVTCIKPSGTASLLLGGISSGIHPHPGEYYLRRVREGDGVIVIPCHGGPGPWIDNLSAVEHIKIIERVSAAWVRGNSISATVAVDWESEGEEVVEAVKKSNLRSLTFVPKKLTGYKDLPREVVSKDVWDKYVREWKGIKAERDGLPGIECGGGACDAGILT